MGSIINFFVRKSASDRFRIEHFSLSTTLSIYSNYLDSNSFSSPTLAQDTCQTPEYSQKKLCQTLVLVSWKSISSEKATVTHEQRVVVFGSNTSSLISLISLVGTEFNVDPEVS
ncbi:hypothetical protein BPOR_0610g00050 [Botrytis porri]|uniref:Uncharacterized protein n=1 Tax=Botrytis porri TaxID=87229 RepID=A0A4Z1KQC6_9HELO|nr:hypothetical protein BPOR_0610g00050 [Botrytis porri]